MAIEITKGSPNIFRDLGFSSVEAEHLRVRAELMLALERLIARRRLTQARAANKPVSPERSCAGALPSLQYRRPGGDARAGRRPSALDD